MPLTPSEKSKRYRERIKEKEKNGLLGVLDISTNKNKAATRQKKYRDKVRMELDDYRKKEEARALKSRYDKDRRASTARGTGVPSGEVAEAANDV